MNFCFSITWGLKNSRIVTSHRNLRMQRISRVATPLLQHKPRWIQISRGPHLVSPTLHAPYYVIPSSHRFYSFQNSFPAKSCPSCGSPLNMREISCGNCRDLTPLPENINYLSLFGFPSKPPFEFDLDLRKLKNEYLRMMSKVHPDSVIDKSEVRNISPMTSVNGRSKSV
jgi:hypothetical protein